MKKILSFLICAVMLFAMVPFTVHAVDVIFEADLTVDYPVAGNKPDTVGHTDNSSFTIVEVNWYPVYADNSTGMLLYGDAVFEAGQKYRAQAKLQPVDGYAFSSYPDVLLNDHYCDTFTDSDGFCYASYDFIASSGKKVTVTFDAYGYGLPKKIELFDYQCVWDAIDDFDEVDLGDCRSELAFWDWSLDPFAAETSDYYDFYTPVTEDITLYPMWVKKIDNVMLYIEPPYAGADATDTFRCVHDLSDPFLVSDINNWWTSIEGAINGDYPYTGTFVAGETYFTRLTLYPSSGTAFNYVPRDLEIMGGSVVEAFADHGYLYVYVAVEVQPSMGTINYGTVMLPLPEMGMSSDSYSPDPVSYDPGLKVSCTGVWTNPSCTGETFSGIYAPETTYYMMLNFSGAGGADVNYEYFDFELRGGAEIVEIVDLASWYHIPNIVGAVVSFRVPHYVTVTIQAPEGKGAVCTSLDPVWSYDQTVHGFEGVEFTAWAKDGPDTRFVGWYAKNGVLISTANPCNFEAYELEVIHAEFAPRNPFVDVQKGAFYYDAVLWALNHQPQVTKGTDETHFSPKDTCSRAQVVTFLWRAFGAPEPSSTVNPFKDVKSSAYYYKAVLWAVENGITNGIDPTHFGPDKGCTRGQVVSFLWRAEGEPLPSPGSNPFTDVKEGKFYYGAVQWANQQNITNGTDATHFSPDATCTRGQIVTFLMRDVLG